MDELELQDIRNMYLSPVFKVRRSTVQYTVGRQHHTVVLWWEHLHGHMMAGQQLAGARAAAVCCMLWVLW
jgi:hypothetical protein